MRSIKFRAWNEEEGVMIDGDSLAFEEYAPITDLLNQDGIMQYTGLKDKTGVEIYEGDILVCSKYIGGNWIDTCYERGYVEFVYGAFGLHRKQGFYRPFKDWLEDYELEVIGNIHENPELLKGGTPNE